MSVQHSGVGLESYTVNISGHVKPPLIIQFGPKKLLMDAVTEDLSPTARNAGEARALEIFQDISERLFRRPGDLRQLNHGKGLNLSLRTGRADRLNDIEVILIWELRVDSRHHMDLPNHLMAVFIKTSNDIRRGEHVAPGIPRGGIEGAELAQFITDIGVVDVKVPDIVRGFPAHALSN
jgi:hypothetical protein